jgi:hypothetical protein
MTGTIYHKALCCVPFLGDLMGYSAEEELKSAIASWASPKDAAGALRMAELEQLRAQYATIEKIRSLAAVAFCALGTCLSESPQELYLGLTATGLYLARALYVNVPVPQL